MGFCLTGDSTFDLRIQNPRRHPTAALKNTLIPSEQMDRGGVFGR
jgi:hypothetical protein